MFNKLFKSNFLLLAASLVFALAGCSEKSSITNPQQDVSGVVLVNETKESKDKNTEKGNTKEEKEPKVQKKGGPSRYGLGG